MVYYEVTLALAVADDSELAVLHGLLAAVDVLHEEGLATLTGPLLAQQVTSPRPLTENAAHTVVPL